MVRKDKKLSRTTRKKRRIKNNEASFRLFLLFFSVFVISVFSTIIVYNLTVQKNHPVYENKIPVYIRVVEPFNVMVNSRTDAFYFGGGPRGSILKLNFNITNSIEKDVFVVLSVEGRVSDWISFSENNFVLEPGETKNIIVIAEIPMDAELGYYNQSFIVIREFVE